MIYLAADHQGFDAKEAVKLFLKENGYEFEDLGPYTYEKTDDYPDYSFKLGEKVAATKQQGIIICGSGIGVTIAANKVKGVRAGYVESEQHAELARKDDDTNILVLDAVTFSPETDFPIIVKWLNTEFSWEERHARRIKKITDYENRVSL